MSHPNSETVQVATQPTQTRASSHRRLMLAVLNEALQTYATGLTSRAVARRSDACQVELWTSSNSTEWPFAFVNVCEVLGVDPDYLRARMRRLRLELFSSDGPAH